MKLPHFFKAKSRIGLINAPIHHKKLNIGVEDGSDAVLTQKFTAQFKQNQISSFEFPKPESLDSKKFNSILAVFIKDFKNLINSSLKHNQIQIVVGGDHSITLPSVLAVIDRYDAKNLGYIQFDSHGDINLKSVSPTNNFHGMYVRPLVDKFDILEIERLVPNKIPTQNLLYIGNLDLDPEEKVFFKQNNIVNINKLDLTMKKAKSLKQFKNFISGFKHLHVTFDIDCLDQSIAPATGIPAKNGLLLGEIHQMLQIISKHSNTSFDLCEVNPHKKGSEKTVDVAQQILKIIIK